MPFGGGRGNNKWARRAVAPQADAGWAAAALRLGRQGQPEPGRRGDAGPRRRRAELRGSLIMNLVLMIATTLVIARANQCYYDSPGPETWPRARETRTGADFGESELRA